MAVPSSEIIVEFKKTSEWYELKWSDGYVGRYPYVWLRDNCRCSACYYLSSIQRSALFADLDVDEEPTGESLEDDGRIFKTFWRDGHTSSFEAKHLYLNRFDKTDFDPVQKIIPKSWGSEMIDTLPKFDYDMLMEDSATLRDWLASLIITGLALIKNAPKEPGILETIGKRVGYLKKTVFGNIFEVIAISDANSIAYTTKELGLHCDLPVYEDPPSVQMLHCIKQVKTVGGENQFADAKKVAEDLKKSEPEVYDTLTSVKVDFRIRGADFMPFHLQTSRPVISLDKFGNFKSVCISQVDRAPYMNIPVEDVKHFYRCSKKFEKLLYDKENIIKFKMTEGDVVTFDNNRVLHARKAFRVDKDVPHGEKTRHLQGAYLDWDIIHSTLRLMEEELKGLPIIY